MGKKLNTEAFGWGEAKKVLKITMITNSQKSMASKVYIIIKFNLRFKIQEGRKENCIKMILQQQIKTVFIMWKKRSIRERNISEEKENNSHTCRKSRRGITNWKSWHKRVAFGAEAQKWSRVKEKCWHFSPALKLPSPQTLKASHLFFLLILRLMQTSPERSALHPC